MYTIVSRQQFLYSKCRIGPAHWASSIVFCIDNILDVSIPIPSYPPGQGMGFAKGYVPEYGVRHTLHYSFVLVFYESTFHHTLGPGYGEHTLWRRVHTLIPGYIPGYGTSKDKIDR